MTEQRYQELMENDSKELTKEEIAQGWHFCTEFDGLLVGPGSTELAVCKCWPKDHPVYQTTPPMMEGA